MFDGLRLPADDAPEPERDAPERKVAEDPETALRRARTRALIRHARAWDALLSAPDTDGKADPEQMRELTEARKAFEEVRPHGWRDAEAAYLKDQDLIREVADGKINRAVRALQLETEIRTDPQRRADRFVERWRDLGRSSERRYAAGDYSGYRAARKEMGNMAMGLEHDAQMESLLQGRKRELGIDFDSGHSLGRDLAISHGLGRGRGIGL